ncbi:MAG: 3-dehydroquinate dehydratase [Sulfurimonas sp.]|uniref:3-dehydroquinate dehydratase n=1 Tax=Sulfurimonas sp. TaxID=2022749 RepID=UPI00262C5713|nr:3-dehydroquinate dehydratase [Sulfurimonas sp.]MDD3475642.1 3-dehydroquinate dehydratase [Sulfurimonas sp.]
MKYSRGLLALILTLFFNSSLVAQYLYKDELIFNPAFNAEIEKLGSELYQTTGISLRLVMLKKLPDSKNIVEYEKELLGEFNTPTILLTFSQMESKVDILANETSLYNYFDKEQVLSPVASPVQAFIIALFYSNSFSMFKDTLSNYGGTIIPLLAQKSKDEELLGKYSGSMFNGYADIAEQIAASKGVVLKNAVGSVNQQSIFFVKLFFYGFIFYGIFLYIKRKLYLRKQKNETK